ncbi:MAG: DNA topoisomerase III [Clostridiales bacterium]|jgi:DNA topoisomerase-3|nr:DNA topoisomerase III [Clostridiales bacterium]
MSKTLVIAEKPSVGRDIAKVLGASKKGDGFLFSDEYIISWAIGHLVTLFDPEDYDEALKKWKLNTLPIIPAEIKLKGIKNTKSQLLILQKLMNGNDVSEIVCATDSGREGELIFRYIYNLVKCKKPVKRLWISSMTDTAIKGGFAKLKDSSEYDNLYYSAKCRSEADWLVGINASRAYTLRYDALLSIGRVQTPTLALIAERQKEINAFVPKDYWNVKAEFEKENGAAYFGLWIDKNEESAIDTQEAAEAIVSKLRGVGGEVIKGEVKKIDSEEKKQPPQLLYDLTELQRDANKKFGFSAKKTLQVAQDLYEKRKMITYPRTDSRYLSSDMAGKIGSVLDRLAQSPYAQYAEYVKSLEKLPLTKRIIDDSKISDHHAIIPTEAKINLETLNADEKKVYDLIARKFLQAFYPYYIYSVTKIITEAAGENFLTKGTTVIQLGFMELYKDEKTEGEPVLPQVTTGEAVAVKDVLSEKKKTKPPKAYTEASLLSAMENAGRFAEDETVKEQMKDSGIGTPATRAAIIERLIDVGYIERLGKTLSPTEKGMKLIEVVPKELKSPETTGRWEKGLNSIAKGKMEPKRFMESINRYVYYIVGESANKAQGVTFPEEGRRGKRTAGNGAAAGNAGAKNAAGGSAGGKGAADSAGGKTAAGNAGGKGAAGAAEGKTSAAGTADNSLGVCPLCQSGDILENSKAFFCAKWRRGCKFTIWKNALESNGIKLTAQIIKKLLAEKTVPELNIFLAATHERATADLHLNIKTEGYLELQNIKRPEE